MAASVRNPVVVILGATGTGKTKLSLEIAKRYNGEIISADSMQVYKGLDVITNKATAEERKAIPHHLIDYLSPLIEDSTVIDFRDKAVPIIDRLLGTNKLPIIVGGTNYYIESLLWKYLINQQDVDKAAENCSLPKAKFPKMDKDGKMTRTLEARYGKTKHFKFNQVQHKQGHRATGHGFRSASSAGNDDLSSEGSSCEREYDLRDHENVVAEDAGKWPLREKYSRMTTPEIYEQLMKVDKTTALKIHPNDRRKQIRALEVYDTFGIPMSEVYKAQHKEAGEGVNSGPLRYPHTCLFWLQCEKEVLRQRLDARVEQMIEDGLVSELTEFHKSYNTHRFHEGKEADYTKGIFQSIGFKEFHNYLLMSEEERQSKLGQQQFEEGKEALKTATKRYARIQNNFVTTRILKSKEALKTATKRYARIQNNFVTTRILKKGGPSDYALPVYGLDCTDVSKWAETVSEPAISILEAIRQGKKPDIDPIDPDARTGRRANIVYNKCNACNKVFTVEHDYLLHLKTKKHKHWNRKYKEKLTELSQILDRRENQLQQQIGECSDEHQVSEDSGQKSSKSVENKVNNESDSSADNHFSETVHSKD